MSGARASKSTAFGGEGGDSARLHPSRYDAPRETAGMLIYAVPPMVSGTQSGNPPTLMNTSLHGACPVIVYCEAAQLAAVSTLLGALSPSRGYRIYSARDAFIGHADRADVLVVVRSHNSPRSTSEILQELRGLCRVGSVVLCVWVVEDVCNVPISAGAVPACACVVEGFEHPVEDAADAVLRRTAAAIVAAEWLPDWIRRSLCRAMFDPNPPRTVARLASRAGWSVDKLQKDWRAACPTASAQSIRGVLDAILLLRYVSLVQDGSPPSDSIKQLGVSRRALRRIASRAASCSPEELVARGVYNAGALLLAAIGY